MSWTKTSPVLTTWSQVEQLFDEDWFVSRWFESGWFIGDITWAKINATLTTWAEINTASTTWEKKSPISTIWITG